MAHSKSYNVELSSYDEDLKALYDVNLCDTVILQDERMNLNASLEVVKTVFDVLDDKYTSIEVVSELPSTGEAGKIYLLAHEHGPQDNYDEYIYYSGAWEKIGNTDVDLSGYWAKADLVSITNTEIDNIVAQ